MATQSDDWLLEFLLEAPAAVSASESHGSRSSASAAPEAHAISSAPPEATAVSIEEGVADIGIAVEDTESEMLMPGSYMDGSSDNVRHSSEPRAEHSWSANQSRERSPPRQRKYPTGVNFSVVRNPVYEAGVLRRFTWQQVLELCKDKIRGVLRRHPQDNFKIGLTTDLEVRIGGYEREGARTLVAVYSTDSTSEAIFLERSCIGHFGADMRCRNVAPGGEGMHRGVTPVFLYVALGGEIPPKTTDSLLFQWRPIDRLRPKRS